MEDNEVQYESESELDTPETQPLLGAAQAPLESAMLTPWPVSLRPLGMLAALALQDVRRGADALRPPASSARLLRVLAHRWTGR